MNNPEQVLLAKVCELYGLSPDVDVQGLREPLKTYVNYAFSSVTRGQSAIGRLQPHRSLKGARCLDVGCAYGGFLAAAVAAGAGEVVGFDVDNRLVSISRAYLQAMQVPAQVSQGDVTDESFVRSLGTFDMISCNDVIEHVNSVPTCINNLAEALRPGGILYMAIPNRLSTALIRSDPHFHLYGIVLMSRPDAIRYHTLIAGTDHYDVGDYFAFEHYKDLLQRHGLQVTVTNAPPKTAHWCLRELRPDFAALRAENDKFSHPRLPSGLVARVRQVVSDTIDSFMTDIAEYDAMLAAKHVNLATTKSISIATRYYLPTWYFLAHKSTDSL